jgi:hypothetical protein
MSKGSSRRPAAVTPEEYARNWERAFLKKQLDAHVQRVIDRTNAMIYGEHGPHDYNAPVDGLTEPGDPYRTYPARGEQRREDEA